MQIAFAPGQRIAQVWFVKDLKDASAQLSSSIDRSLKEMVKAGPKKSGADLV